MSKSTLKNPGYAFSKSKERCHKMSFNITVSKTMITYQVYDMICISYFQNKKNEYYYFRNHEQVNINEMTAKEIEAELRFNLKYKGLDFFEKEDMDQDKLVVAEDIVKLRFPKYFKNNSLNFIME